MADFSSAFSLFPNTDKKNEKAPDYRGTIEISTAELQDVINYLQNSDHEMNWQDEPVIKLSVSAWANESKNGKKYLKGKMQKPYKPETAASPATPSSSELPF